MPEHNNWVPLAIKEVMPAPNYFVVDGGVVVKDVNPAYLYKGGDALSVILLL